MFGDTTPSTAIRKPSERNSRSRVRAVSSRISSVSERTIHASSAGFRLSRRAVAATVNSGAQSTADESGTSSTAGPVCWARASDAITTSSAAASAGRGSASYPRSTPSMRSITGWSATPGRFAAAAGSEDALPIIAAFKLPLDSFSVRNTSLVVPVTHSHRASNKTVSSGTAGVHRCDLRPGCFEPPGGVERRPFR